MALVVPIGACFLVALGAVTAQASGEHEAGCLAVGDELAMTKSHGGGGRVVIEGHACVLKKARRHMHEVLEVAAQRSKRDGGCVVEMRGVVFVNDAGLRSNPEGRYQKQSIT
jgi:hypothetical protein